MKFDFDDILLIPEIISKINSRKEINPYTKTKMLPIMTAPMDTVIDISNFTEFHKNKIYSILPRGKDGIIQGINCWNSYGLKEFKERFIDKDFYYPNEEKKNNSICFD